MQVGFYKREIPSEIAVGLANMGPANELIEMLKKTHPHLVIREDGDLYKAAVYEYNQNVRASKTRPPVPDWYCGHTNADGTLEENFGNDYVYNLNSFGKDWYVERAAVWDVNGNVVDRA